MKRILGMKENWNNQRNDASVELLQDYFAKQSIVACGPNAFAEGLEIGGWPNPFPGSMQWSDGIMMVMHNPFNLKYFMAKRKLNYDKYPPNEVPQCYDVVADLLYGEAGKEIRFKWGISVPIILMAINAGKTVMFARPGHYSLFTGYDTRNEVLFYDDPNKGFRKKMPYAEFEKVVKAERNYRIEIPRYIGGTA